jgi:hypothetical protein
MKQELTEKLARLGYPDFDVLPGQDSILMLFIAGKLICGALYALALSDEALKALIVETVPAVQVAQEEEVSDEDND